MDTLTAAAILAGAVVVVAWWAGSVARAIRRHRSGGTR